MQPVIIRSAANRLRVAAAAAAAASAGTPQLIQPQLLSLATVPAMADGRRSKYSAAFLDKLDEPLVIRTVETESKLTGNQVLVRVDSAGVNNPDLKVIQGNNAASHEKRSKLPFVPGFELAGEVMGVGSEVSEFREGDRVLGIKHVGMGAFAQECVMEQEELYNIPYSLDYERAVSLPIAYCTALLALRQIKHIDDKTNALVLTSQGSTGLAAIDLMQNVYKAKVIGATESEAKCEQIRAMGVLSTLEYTDENLVKKVRKVTKDVGADIVFDTVGGKWFELAFESLRPGGCSFNCGFSSGEYPSVSTKVVFDKQISMSGVWLGGYCRRNPAGFRSLLKEVISLLDDKYISPVKGRVFPLADVNDALRAADLKTDALGKVILTLRE